MGIKRHKPEEIVQRQVGSGLSQPFIFFLEALHSFSWSVPSPPYLFGGKTVHWTFYLSACTPAVIGLFSHANLPDHIQTRHSLPVRTSTCRNFVTLSSGFGRLLPMCVLRFPKYGGGPLQWGKTTGFSVFCAFSR